MPTLSRPRQRLAKRQVRDADHIERISVPLANRAMTKVRIATLRGVPGMVAMIQREVTPLLRQAMVAGHLTGRRRLMLQASKALARRRRFSALDDAVSFLQSRLKLSDAQLEGLERQYTAEAVQTVTGYADRVQRDVSEALSESVTVGAHVRKGKQAVSAAFAKTGVTSLKPHLTETIFRTQVNLAYQAGRVAASRQPEIDEIMWGWEYSATLDDRVRPNHAALNGTRLSKDDPHWGNIMPPNGFNCRCTAVEIFKDESDLATSAPPPAETMPDQGWEFNPGDVAMDIMDLPLPT